MVITIASNHFENLSIAQLESLSLEPTGKKNLWRLKTHGEEDEDEVFGKDIEDEATDGQDCQCWLRVYITRGNEKVRKKKKSS